VDVEKTIEFILSQQARTEAALGRLAETQQQTDALLKRSIRAAVQEARIERRRRQELADRFSAAHEAVAAEQRELAVAQRRTEASLAAFIESMRLGGNGHPKS
jgi:hypothetical protein